MEFAKKMERDCFFVWAWQFRHGSQERYFRLREEP